MKDLSVFLNVMGPARLESAFLRGHPDLEGKVEDLKVENCICPNCNNKTLLLGRYRLIGDVDYQERLVRDWCNDCQTKIESFNITKGLYEKRKAMYRANWTQLTYDDAGFKNFNKYSKCTRNAVSTSSTYTQKIIAGETKNLLMMGSPGTGKTHLASAIFRTLDHKGVMVGYITAVELFKRIKDTFGKPGAENRLFEEIKALTVLIIDDMGVETSKIQKDVSWTHSKWVEIIEARRNLSTVYTTNFDDSKIRDIVGERAASRLYENSDFIDLFTDDYRKRQHTNREE